VFTFGLTLASLVVLAVETNIFNVIHKADLWQDMGSKSAIFSTRIATFEL